MATTTTTTTIVIISTTNSQQRIELKYGINLTYPTSTNTSLQNQNIHEINNHNKIMARIMDQYMDIWIWVDKHNYKDKSNIIINTINLIILHKIKTNTITTKDNSKDHQINNHNLDLTKSHSPKLRS